MSSSTTYYRYSAGSSTGVILNVAEPRTVTVSNETVSPAIAKPGATVTYSARVEDNTGAAIRSGFTARLIVGDTTVDVPFSDYYDETTRTVSVSFSAPTTPGTYAVKLEWDEQVVQAGDIFVVYIPHYIPHFSYYTWGGT